MPELPDLEAFSYNLNKKLQSKTLNKVTVIVDRKVEPPEKELNKTLAGATLNKVIRNGKTLQFLFDNGHYLGWHLMLHGGLTLIKNQEPEPKFAIISLDFEDGQKLVLSDFQKAAATTLDPPQSSVPDALEVTEDYLSNKLSNKKTVLKTALMDQKVLRGIGNAYADEILWHARISPQSVSEKIPKENIKTLIASIKTVLKNAEKSILKEKPDIISGEVRSFLKVHLPNETKTETGAVIKKDTINSRKTYFTDEQELFK